VRGLRKNLLFGLALVVSIMAASGNALAIVLETEAAASPVNAAAGNSESALLLVSVMNPKGAPVNGLGPSNFKVDATIVAPGGALVDITRADEASRAPGFYIIEIVPTTYRGTQYTWKAGIYLFAVTVERDGDRGQTIAEMEIKGASGLTYVTPSETATPETQTTVPASTSLLLRPTTDARLVDLTLTVIERPKAPTNLVKVGDLPCQIKWSDNAKNEDGYNIYIGGSCTNCMATSDSSWRKVASVGPDVDSYTWSQSCCAVAECSCIMVRAFNQHGESSNSNVIMLAPIC
jgi:hypothetical protein